MTRQRLDLLTPDPNRPLAVERIALGGQLPSLDQPVDQAATHAKALGGFGDGHIVVHKPIISHTEHTDYIGRTLTLCGAEVYNGHTKHIEHTEVAIVDGAKVCPRCKERKSLDCFNRNRRAPDGLQSYCRDCGRTIDHLRRQQKRPVTPWTPSETARFWSFVEKTDDCWLWQGAVFPRSGYGRIQKNNRHYFAHRAAYEIAYGPIPPELNICHSCDVSYPVGDRTYRRCVRPDHLFLGTTAENIADRCQKGRSASGERHGWHKHPEALPHGEQCHTSKLTEEQVLTILNDDRPAKQLATEFGVSKSAIDRVRERKTWTHVRL